MSLARKDFQKKWGAKDSDKYEVIDTQSMTQVVAPTSIGWANRKAKDMNDNATDKTPGMNYGVRYASRRYRKNRVDNETTGL